MDLEFYDSFNGNQITRPNWVVIFGVRLDNILSDFGYAAVIEGNVGHLDLNVESATTKGIHFFFACTDPQMATVLKWRDASLNELGSLRISALQLPEIWIGTASATYTGTTPIQSSILYHVQLKIVKHTSTGEVEFILDGNPEIHQTGINTGADAIAQLLWTNSHFANDLYLDSVLIDRDGLLGVVHMDSVFPEAAGDLSGWTPSGAATIYETVDDITPDDDTTHSESIVNGDRYLVRFPVFTTLPESIDILAMAYEPTPKKISTGQIKHLLKEGGNLDVGSATDLVTTYRMEPKVYEVNPRTSVDWIRADLVDTGDKFQAGLESVL